MVFAMASPLLTPELEYRDYKKEDDESCKALEMRAMQGKTNIRKSPLWLVMHTCGRCGELHRLYFCGVNLCTYSFAESEYLWVEMLWHFHTAQTSTTTAQGCSVGVVTSH